VGEGAKSGVRKRRIRRGLAACKQSRQERGVVLSWVTVEKAFRGRKDVRKREEKRVLKGKKCKEGGLGK